MKNYREQVSERIAEIKAKKTADLDEINKKREMLREQIKTAETRMEEATAALDADTYCKVKNDLERLKVSDRMYSDRLEQISKHRDVDEAESDRTIDALLKYEKDLAAEYDERFRETLLELAKVLKEYRTEVSLTEDVIVSWTRSVFPNYRSSSRIFAETGTRRSPKPIPVHPVQYLGSDLSLQLFRVLFTPTTGLLQSLGIEYDSI